MKRTAIGVLAGTAVLFAWGAISWMALPWHNAVIKKLPEEQLIMDTLKTVIPDPGFYCFPNARENAEKYRKGPVGIVIFAHGGTAPMPPKVFIVDLIGDAVLASISMLLLCLSRDRVKSVVPRAFLVMMVGLAVGAAAHLMYWNWFHFPADLTRVAICDALIAFFLLGLTQAKFVPRD